MPECLPVAPGAATLRCAFQQVSVRRTSSGMTPLRIGEQGPHYRPNTARCSSGFWRINPSEIGYRACLRITPRNRDHRRYIDKEVYMKSLLMVLLAPMLLH